MNAPDELGRVQHDANEFLRRLRRLRSDLDRTLARCRALQTNATAEATCASVESSEPDFPPDPPTELVSHRE